MRTRRCAKYSMRSSSVHLAVGTDMPALLHIDPTRVRQVVMNGLTNAAKYGGGTPIELVARLTDSGEILIEVLDGGRGLGGHTLEEFCAEFSGVSRGVSAPPQTAHALGESAFNKVRSTGMGIPICVRLAELMGGSLGLTDREDGPGARMRPRRESCTRAFVCRVLHAGDCARACAGTRFVLNLPSSCLAAAPVGASTIVETRTNSEVARPTAPMVTSTPVARARLPPLHLAEAMPFAALGEPAPAQERGAQAASAATAPAGLGAASMPLDAAGGATEARAPAGARVLVVDDSEANRRFACFLLRRLGCAAKAVADGDEVLPTVAAAAAAGAPFDVVLMDLVMVRRARAMIARHLFLSV